MPGQGTISTLRLDLLECLPGIPLVKVFRRRAAVKEMIDRKIRT